MQKTAKSVLADALKPDVRPSHAEELQVVSLVLDGGHLLQGVIWERTLVFALMAMQTAQCQRDSM